MSSELRPEQLVGRRLRDDSSIVVAKLIGHGGSGSIFLGWDEKHQRSVALKIFRREMSTSSVGYQRFLREGERFGALAHPNIVRVYGTGTDHGVAYLVIEHVAGRNLYEVLEREGPFPLRKALRVCRDSAAGLAEAHRHGIVHRDLKPENIMVRTADEVVKVLDFGIAKDLRAQDDLTQLGTYIGTPAYSAPEQVRGEKVDHRADIFSLGVILYELLTGQVAFEGRHSTEILHATLRDRPIPVSQINRQVTSPVATVLDRMIEKAPAARHQNMAEVMADLDRVLAAVQADYSAEDESSVRLALKKIFEI